MTLSLCARAIVLRNATCCKHGHRCSVEDKVADVHCAGTVCCGFSAIGDQQGESAMSHAHLIVWAGQRACLQEPIIIQENVTNFPAHVLQGMLPQYEWTSAVLCPTHYGWPVRRERQIMMQLVLFKGCGCRMRVRAGMAVIMIYNLYL